MRERERADDPDSQPIRLLDQYIWLLVVSHPVSVLNFIGSSHWDQGSTSLNLALSQLAPALQIVMGTAMRRPLSLVKSGESVPMMLS